MNIRQIEFFVAVVDHGSFTEAAAELHVAQSTVSSGISSLEHDLGGPLLDRSTRSLELTTLGRRCLPAARDVLDAVRRLGSGVAASPPRSRLRVGLITGLDHLDIPQLLSTFCTHHPAIDLSLRVHPQGSSGLISDTRQGRLDLSFISTGHTSHPELCVHHLAWQPFAALLPQGHPRAGQRTVTLEELVGETFLDMPSGFGIRDQLDTAFARIGVDRRVSLEVPDLASLPTYVSAGMGIAIVTQPVSTDHEVVQVPVTSLPANELCLIHRESPRPSVTLFVDAVRHHLLHEQEPQEAMPPTRRATRTPPMTHACTSSATR